MVISDDSGREDKHSEARKDLTAPEPTSERSEARTQFALSNIGREDSSAHFRLFWIRWLALPLVVLTLLGMVVGLVLGLGSPGPVIGGILSLAVAVKGLLSFSRTQMDDQSGLQWNREGLLRDQPDVGDDDPGLLRE